MKKTFKYIILVLVVILVSSSLSSYYVTSGIDDYAYVIALGIDSSDNNNIKLSFQFTKPTNSSESSSSNSNFSYVYAIDCSSIDIGINLLNTYLSKRINLSHCKIIVFSEEIAYNGLSKYMYTFLNSTQIRPDTSIIISKCTANQFIQNSESKIETILTKYYETKPNSDYYTGYTYYSKAIDFFNALSDSTSDPYTVLGNVNANSRYSNSKVSSVSEKDSDITAGNVGFEGKSSAETLGLAVFKDDKLVGELSAIHTLCHLIVTNKFKSGIISIINPSDENSNIDVFLTKTANTKVKVSIINGSPYIKLDVPLKARLISMDEKSQYISQDVLSIVSKSINNYLQMYISEYLYLTAKNFNSDIAGFGKHVINQFLTTSDFEKYNWLENYKNSFFNVTVDTKVKSGFLLLKT